MGIVTKMLGTAIPSVPFVYIQNTDTPFAVTLLFLAVLIYACVQDIKTREVSNYIHIAIVAIAFIDFVAFERRNLLLMLLGAVVTALPLFIAAMLKSGSIGGADIKLMAACGLLLGANRGITALMLGMFLGVVCTFIIRKFKKADIKASFPLIPYLAVGCVTAYII